MKRTYVFRFLFTVLAVCSVAAFVGLAGGSDLGLFSTGEVFGFGVPALALAAFGVWGARLCGDALQPRRTRRPVMRVVTGHSPKEAA